MEALLQNQAGQWAIAAGRPACQTIILYDRAGSCSIVTRRASEGAIAKSVTNSYCPRVRKEVQSGACSDPVGGAKPLVQIRRTNPASSGNVNRSLLLLYRGPGMGCGGQAGGKESHGQKVQLYRFAAQVEPQAQGKLPH